MSVLTQQEATDKRNRLMEQNKTVVFTNGCFDLLHRGHLHLLSESRQQGDYLVVGVNTDDSIRRLKGADRPVKSKEDRGQVLDALSMVNDVVFFGEDTPRQLIQRLTPDVLVKGSDYEPSEVVGAQHVKKNGGRLHLVDLLPGHSTSALIEKIKHSDGEGTTHDNG
ncbi:MAG: D-glycero-beta-D-manno-heptose 1-phosphate adenylyltransferase [bacterium]